MKNLIFILFILFIALIQEAIAQHIKVNGGAGIGFFNLSEYKKLNDDVLAALPVQGQLISNFPGTISPVAAIVIFILPVQVFRTPIIQEITFLTKP